MESYACAERAIILLVVTMTPCDPTGFRQVLEFPNLPVSVSFAYIQLRGIVIFHY